MSDGERCILFGRPPPLNGRTTNREAWERLPGAPSGSIATADRVSKRIGSMTGRRRSSRQAPPLREAPESGRRSCIRLGQPIDSRSRSPETRSTLALSLRPERHATSVRADYLHRLLRSNLIERKVFADPACVFSDLMPQVGLFRYLTLDRNHAGSNERSPASSSIPAARWRRGPSWKEPLRRSRSAPPHPPDPRLELDAPPLS